MPRASAPRSKRSLRSRREGAIRKDQLLGFAERLAQLIDPQRALYDVRHEARAVLESLVSHDDLALLAPGEPSFNLAHVDELVVSFQWEREGDRVEERILSTELRSGALMRLRDAIVGLRKKFRLRRCRVSVADEQICGNFFVPTRRQEYCEMHKNVMKERLRKDRRKTERRLREAKARAQRIAAKQIADGFHRQGKRLDWPRSRYCE
jgi:hypothetical protein